jgi:hypothetical protein
VQIAGSTGLAILLSSHFQPFESVLAVYNAERADDRGVELNRGLSLPTGVAGPCPCSPAQRQAGPRHGINAFTAAETTAKFMSPTTLCASTLSSRRARDLSLTA